MMLVEVSLAKIITTISTKKALDNIITIWRELNCDKYDCGNRNICFPNGLYDGDRVKIFDVDGKANCSSKFDISIVSVQPLVH